MTALLAEWHAALFWCACPVRRAKLCLHTPLLLKKKQKTNICRRWHFWGRIECHFAQKWLLQCIIVAAEQISPPLLHTCPGRNVTLIQLLQSRLYYWNHSRLYTPFFKKKKTHLCFKMIDDKLNHTWAGNLKIQPPTTSIHDILSYYLHVASSLSSPTSFCLCMYVCVTGVPGCLLSEAIGDVVGDRPGTVLPWRPSRSPRLCGVRLPAMIQATAHRSAIRSEPSLKCCL